MGKVVKSALPTVLVNSKQHPAHALKEFRVVCISWNPTAFLYSRQARYEVA